MFCKEIAIITLFLYCVSAQEKIQTEKNSGCLCENSLEVCCPDRCVAYYLCNNGSVNTDGTNLLDIRSLSPIARFQAPRKNYTVQSDKETTKPLIPIDKTTKCGYHKPGGIHVGTKNISNNTAGCGEFPWMVALIREETIEKNSKSFNVYQCGGALIHPQVVVTTAYCVQANKTFKIRAGEWDSQTKIEPYPHQDKEVETIVVHPEYHSGPLQNDIALLFLKEPVEITEYVNVICLPPQGSVIDNGRCYASGWGKNMFGKSGRYSEILKKIDLPIVPNASCQDALRKVRLGEDFVLHESFICAGGEQEKDTCTGDGGGPLVCPIPGEKDRYQQVGIVSWGVRCGEKDVPGVYVNLALFRNWIDHEMDLRNLAKSTYQY